MVLLLSACSESQPPLPTPTLEATATQTQQPATSTTEATATEPIPTEVPPTATQEPLYKVPSFTCPGAVPTRLGLGVIARVTYSSGEGLRIRTSPRIVDSNIFDLVAEGDYVDILDGPTCFIAADGSAYVFWEIRDRQADITGWVAEGQPGNYYLQYNHPPRQLRDDTQLIAAYEEAYAILMNPELAIGEKRAQLRVVQRDYGEEVLVRVIEYVPVYGSDLNYFHNFDAFMRDFISQYGNWSSDSPFESDPIAAGLSIFFDPSVENISEMLGLD